MINCTGLLCHVSQSLLAPSYACNGDPSFDCASLYDADPCDLTQSVCPILPALSLLPLPILTALISAIQNYALAPPMLAPSLLAPPTLLAMAIQSLSVQRLRL